MAKLQASSYQNNGKISFKIDAGSISNILAYYVYKILSMNKNILTQTKNKNIKLKPYNKTTIRQSGMSYLTITHKEKQNVFE